MEPFRPTYAHIDLSAIKDNIREIKKVIPSSTKFMAIVKANAYGHGAVEVSKAAEESGADYLGVATLGEALEIRAASVRTPILVLSETPQQYVERLIDASVTQTVYTLEMAQALSDTARQKGKKAKIHIKIDTGMGRVGVLHKQAVELICKINDLPNVFIEGVFTHFSKADDKKSSFTDKQFKIFTDIIAKLKGLGIDPPIKHAANSAAAILYPHTRLDMVRIGIAMYGLYPFVKGRKIKIRPALSFKSKVIYLKKVPPGTTLSYGGTFVTKKNTCIATLPVGYADGFFRSMSNKGSVLIKGKKYPIVGRVTMDMTLADVKNDKIEIGDEAVLIGSQKNKSISADEIAGLDNTINYEVICSIGKRVPRVYSG